MKQVNCTAFLVFPFFQVLYMLLYFQYCISNILINLIIIILQCHIQVQAHHDGFGLVGGILPITPKYAPPPALAISNIFPLFCQKNVDFVFCNFHAVFGHFVQNVPHKLRHNGKPLQTYVFIKTYYSAFFACCT